MNLFSRKELVNMEELNAVQAAEKLVDEILTKAKEERYKIDALLEKEAKDIAKHTAEMETATDSGDLKAYQKAKANRQNATDAKEMHEARLSTLGSKALISKADYEQTVANVYTEIAALEDEVKQKLAELSNQMNQEANKLEDAAERANAVLYRLQEEVYRNADRTRNNKGIMLRLPNENKKLDKWETIFWGRKGVSSEQYKNYVGKKA